MSAPGQFPVRVLPRPMSLGEILDRTFQIYRGRFWVFVGIAVMPVTGKMALTLLGMLIDRLIGQTTLTFGVKQALTGDIEWFALRIAYSFLHFLIWPVFAILAARMFVRDKLEIQSAFQECLTRWRSWIILGSVFWLIESELPHRLRVSRLLRDAWITMPYWLSAILASLEGFVLIAPVLLSIPAWSMEKLSVKEAIARSWTLSKRSYRRMFAGWMLAFFISWPISVILGGLIFAASRMILGDQWAYSSYARARMSVPAYASSILIAPLIPIAITLIYYDQRIRLEGFDIEWMMLQAGYPDGINVSGPAKTPEPEVAGAPVGETQR